MVLLLYYCENGLWCTEICGRAHNNDFLFDPGWFSHGRRAHRGHVVIHLSPTMISCTVKENQNVLDSRTAAGVTPFAPSETTPDSFFATISYHCLQ